VKSGSATRSAAACGGSMAKASVAAASKRWRLIRGEMAIKAASKSMAAAAAYRRYNCRRRRRRRRQGVEGRRHGAAASVAAAKYGEAAAAKGGVARLGGVALLALGNRGGVLRGGWRACGGSAAWRKNIWRGETKWRRRNARQHRWRAAHGIGVKLAARSVAKSRWKNAISASAKAAGRNQRKRRASENSALLFACAASAYISASAHCAAARRRAARKTSW